jgi:hypothetical protein
MRNVQGKIKDIVDQLQQLNLQQSQLLQWLGRLNEDTGDSRHTLPQQVATARHAAPNTVQHFAVGDRVRIKNPGLLQPNSGTITNITSKRVTIQALSGTWVINIVRAPKNLTLE